MIEIKNVSYSFHREEPDGRDEEIKVLKNISLNIKEGEFVAILGHNGSGKSTLAKMIAKQLKNMGALSTGKVARMTDFGAFIELETGVDALLHVSQISKDHIEKPSDVLKVGDTVTAKVVDFNEADKKISLSVKALFAPEVTEKEEAKVEEDDADIVSVDIDAVIAAEEAADAE